jgi:hypothetical protein
MQKRSRHRMAVCIREPGMISTQPALEGNPPNQVWRLQHVHVVGVCRQIHRTHAEGDDVRGSVHLCIKLHASGGRVVHASLHKPAMMLHVVGRLGWFVLRER